MRQKLLDLHEVQKIDLEIRDIEKNRAGFAERLQKLEESIKKVQTEVETLNGQREAIVREIKTLEGTIQAETIKIKKWEARLVEIRNQREYLALSREVEAGKRGNRDAEEKILELMAQRDLIDKQLDGLQDRLAEEEVDLGSERATLEGEMHAADTRVKDITERRQALLPKIPKPLLAKYEAVRQKRMGVGLVAVVGGSCQGCNMRLPPQLYNILQRGDTLEQCPSCQRIIVWDHFLLTEGSTAIGEGAEARP